jgi:glycosyltransferase involved in cell wall biosynthesis
MKLSIVVPAFNEEKLLPTTIAAVQTSAAAFEDAGWAWELIVCDNNSTDRTTELARAAGARVVFEPVNQIGRARNQGAAAAAGEWLLFIDADSTPHRALFGRVAELMRGGRVLAGGCVMRTDVDHAMINGLTAAWNRLSRQMRWMAGSFIFCRTDAFREVGGFNEKMYASEEIDLSRRLKRCARRRKLEVVIIDDEPLLTSGRKVHLYTKWELSSLLLRTFLLPFLTIRRRQDYWYDGRR